MVTLSDRFRGLLSRAVLAALLVGLVGGGVGGYALGRHRQAEECRRFAQEVREFVQNNPGDTILVKDHPCLPSDLPQ